MTKRPEDSQDDKLAFADVEPVAELMKSLAHPQRLMIVCTLIEGERAVSELERDLGIHQPSLSQQLATLREASVIIGRRQAKAVIYRIHDERAAALIEALHAIFCEPARRGRQRVQASPAREDVPVPPRRAPPTRVGDAALFARILRGEDA
jgi:DNA-binding transcriptional ArsR family regulator